MAASKVVDRMAKTKMKTKKRTKSPKGEEQSRHPAACGRITILETCVFSAWSILAIAGKMEEVAAYLSVLIDHWWPLQIDPKTAVAHSVDYVSI